MPRSRYSARLAQARSDSGRFAPSVIDALFEELGLPGPAKVSNVLASLEKKGLVTRSRRGKGSWKLTPEGAIGVDRSGARDGFGGPRCRGINGRRTLCRSRSAPGGATVARAPELLLPLRSFLDEHPFDTNVFGIRAFRTSRTTPRPTQS